MITATFDPTSTTSATFNTQLQTNGVFLLANQSNVNLMLTFADGNTAYAPAWQITPFRVPTKSPIVKWQQETILAGSSSPISRVTIDSYQDTSQILGTYPVAIQHTAYVPNQVSTSTMVSTLSSENNGINTEVIDIGTNNNNRLVDIYNDHFIWSVEQSGVAHQIMQGRISGKPLLLGQGGDHVEVGGTLDIDENLFIVGHSTLDDGSFTTDGNGNITVASISNSAGVVRGVQPLLTPYQFVVNGNPVVGTPVTFTLAGNGGIPSNARGVFLSAYGQGVNPQAYLSAYVVGNAMGNPSNATMLFMIQVANQLNVGNGYCPLDSSGRLVIQCFNNNLTNVNISVFAYLA